VRPLLTVSAVLLGLVSFAACGSDDRSEPTTGYDDAGTSGSDSGDGAPGIERPLPSAIVTGPGPHPGSASHVRLVDATGKVANETHETFAGAGYGANVAACDVDGDGKSEIVVGEGPDPAGGTRVRILKRTGELVAELPAAFEGKHHGVNVACGDIDGDGVPELITGLGAGPDNETRVRAFDARTLTRKADFLAYDAGSRYGVRVAAGDVDGDGKAEIITGPGPSPVSGGLVRVFSADGTLRGQVEAFPVDPIYGDVAVPFGATVAAGDLDGDGKAEILASPGPAPLATPRVRTYSSKQPGPLTFVSEFVSENPIPHLLHSGYYHVHSPFFGLHIPDVADFTNTAFLEDPQYLPLARASGLKVILALNKYIHDRPKAEWAANLKALDAVISSERSSIAALYVYDEIDLTGMPVSEQKEIVDLVKANIPGIPTIMSYVSQTAAPPDTLDWVSVDPYVNYGLTEPDTGCARRDYFDALVKGRLDWARSTGKPVFIIAPSFARTLPTIVPMPTFCQQRWYLEEVVERQEVRGILWFMFGHAKFSDVKEEVQGVADFPELLAWHKSMFPVTRKGGYGAELAVGDVDGDGVNDIVVGHGKGRGNTTMVNVHAADGTKKRTFRAYEGALFGVSVAVGKFE
jgi:hypothetical protein